MMESVNASCTYDRYYLGHIVCLFVEMATILSDEDAVVEQQENFIQYYLITFVLLQ